MATAAVALPLPLRFEIRRSDYQGASAGVYNILPSQQLHARSRAGDGGGVPQVIARPRIGAACANALIVGLQARVDIEGTVGLGPHPRLQRRGLLPLPLKLCQGF